MAGFCLAVPALKGSAVYLHSHMLGVLPEFRRQGLGQRLKLEQRREALARGIGLIEWTFDPLELNNAHLNLEPDPAGGTKMVDGVVVPTNHAGHGAYLK